VLQVLQVLKGSVMKKALFVAVSVALTYALNSHRKQQVRDKDYKMLEGSFLRILGPEKLQKLKRAVVASGPVYSIGGDQLTGKSTLAKALAQEFQLVIRSSGTAFRAEAKRRGIAVGELSKIALDDPSIDVSIDYNQCLLLATGTTEEGEGPVLVEGRQPAVMLTYLKHLGRVNTCRIFLSCSIREQALRFISREVDTKMSYVVRARLPDRPYQGLLDVLAEVERLGLDIPSETMQLFHRSFTKNAQRDADDRSRFASLYGTAPILDYRNPDCYDIVLDTSTLSASEVKDVVIAKMREIHVDFT
jgi:cytidylate kinase